MSTITVVHAFYVYDIIIYIYTYDIIPGLPGRGLTMIQHNVVVLPESTLIF